VPERPPAPVDRLTDHIDELESLIGNGSAPQQGSRDIPVLDDVVEPGDAPVQDNPPAGHAELEERLLSRLEAELADLVHVVLEVARRCVREELARHSSGQPGARGGD
jgi:hypothetical protein